MTPAKRRTEQHRGTKKLPSAKTHRSTEANGKHGRGEHQYWQHIAPQTPQHEPGRPRHEGHMSRGQLYEWYKRQGLLSVYFMLYPQG